MSLSVWGLLFAPRIIPSAQAVSWQHICASVKGIFHVDRSAAGHTVWSHWHGQTIGSLPHCRWTDLIYFWFILHCSIMGHLSEGPAMSSCSMYFAWALDGAGKGSRLCKGRGLDGNSCAIQGDLGRSCVFHAHLQPTRRQTQTTRCAQTRPLLSYRQPNLYISPRLSLYNSVHSLAVTDPLSVSFCLCLLFVFSSVFYS